MKLTMGCPESIVFSKYYQSPEHCYIEVCNISSKLVYFSIRFEAMFTKCVEKWAVPKHFVNIAFKCMEKQARFDFKSHISIRQRSDIGQRIENTIL